MADEHAPLKSTDRASEGDRKSETSAKVASESVTDEPQAQAYEPKFKSFSSRNDKVTLDADDPLAQLMAKVNGQRDGAQAGHAVTEFALEDKDAGKLITARGERNLHQPKQSWIDGLKQIADDAKSPEELAQRQGQFSIDYMMRKLPDSLRSAVDSAQKAFTPQEGSSFGLNQPQMMVINEAVVIAQVVPTSEPPDSPVDTSADVPRQAPSDDPIDVSANPAADAPVAAPTSADGSINQQISGAVEDVGRVVLKGSVDFAVERVKEQVGIVHGTLNFGVNLLAGIGNCIRMASAAIHETDPVLRYLPDFDPEGTKMLHDTMGGVASMSRIMVQFGTTLNPLSPLYGMRFDPEGTDLALKCVDQVPKQTLKAFNDLANSDTEHRAAVTTEVMLNIATLFVGAGEVSAASKLGGIKNVTTLIEGAEGLNEAEQIVRAGEMVRAGGEAVEVADNPATQVISKVYQESLEQTATALEESAATAPESAQPALKEVAKGIRDSMPTTVAGDVSVVGEQGWLYRQYKIGDQEINLMRRGHQQWLYGTIDGVTDSTVKVHVTVNGPEDLGAVQRVLLPELNNRESNLSKLVAEYKTHDPLWGIGKDGCGAPPAGVGNDAKGFTIYPREGANPLEIQQEIDRVLAEAGVGLETPIPTGNVDTIAGASNRVGVCRESWPTGVAADGSQGAVIGEDIQLELEREFGRNGAKLTEEQLRELERIMSLQEDILEYSADGQNLLLKSKNRGSGPKKGNRESFYLDESSAGKGAQNNRPFSDRPAMYRIAERYGINVAKK